MAKVLEKYYKKWNPDKIGNVKHTFINLLNRFLLLLMYILKEKKI